MEDIPAYQLRSFEEEWADARHAVVAFCVRSVKDFHTAEDITQQVALRALRGFSSFQGKSKFLTWVLSIASREVARYFGSATHRRHAISLPLDIDLLESLTGTHGVPVRENSSSAPTAEEVFTAAVPSWLSEMEAQVLRLHLLEEQTYVEIADSMGFSANRVALMHFRALPRLRLYIFVQCQPYLGGGAAIQKAFALARQSASSPMPPAEVEVFEEVVIRQNLRYRKAGWKTNLREACARVLRCFPTGTVADIFAAVRHDQVA